MAGLCERDGVSWEAMEAHTALLGIDLAAVEAQAVHVRQVCLCQGAAEQWSGSM